MLHKFSDRVYYSDFDEITNQPVTGYILGNNYSLLIDSTLSSKSTLRLLKEIEEAGLRKPDFVMLTHSHWDHTYGLKPLSVPVIANSLTYEYMKKEKSWPWSNETFKEYREKGVIEPFIAEHMELEYDDFSKVEIVLPDIIYEDQIKLDLGGVTAIAKKTVNAHSKDGSVIFIPEEKAIFLGDSMYTELVGPDWVDHPELVEQYYNELSKLDFDTAFPAHTEHISRKQMFSELKERFLNI